MAGFAEALSAVPDLSSVVSAVAAGRHVGRSITGLGGGFAGSRQGGFAGELHRWLLRRSDKGALELVKRSAEKGLRSWQLQTALVFQAESAWPALPHETKLVETTLEQRFTKEVPPMLIGYKAYDSDPLDEKLEKTIWTELVAPQREDRSKPRTQDRRRVRRYKRRWKVERLFAWLQNFRRLTTRWEHHLSNFLGMVYLAAPQFY